MLTSGMHFRQSIDHNFHSRGLTPLPLLQTDAVHQLLQAVHGGLCCAVMPLDSGLDVLTEDLRIQPIESAQTLVPLGLIMRRGAPARRWRRPVSPSIRNHRQLLDRRHLLEDQ